MSVDIALTEILSRQGRVVLGTSAVFANPEDIVVFNKGWTVNDLVRCARTTGAQVAITVENEKVAKLASKLSGLWDWVMTESEWPGELIAVVKPHLVPPPPTVAALLLDRDGVLNVDHGYVGKSHQVELVPGIVELLKKAEALNLQRLIVTNQSGVGRGYYSEEDYEGVMHKLQELLKLQGANYQDATAAFFHPQSQDPKYLLDRQLRKPRPGGIHRIAAKHNIDLSRSIFVGDKATDMMAACLAGVSRIILNTTEEGEEKTFQVWREGLRDSGLTPDLDQVEFRRTENFKFDLV